MVRARPPAPPGRRVGRYPRAVQPAPGASVDGAAIGRVAEVWRYPVKSLGGEQLVGALCERRGVRGDRRWAVTGEDGRIGSGKTTRRFRRMPGLLSLRARTDDAGDVWVELPDGRRGRVEDPATAAWLSEVTGEPVRLREESGTSHFDDGPLHLVTTGSLSDLGPLDLHGPLADRRRFRPNLLLAADAPLDPPCRLRVGAAAVLAVSTPTARCVMTTMAQPGLAFAPTVLKQLEHHRDGCLGVYATVEREGEVAVGDPVTVLDGA